MKNNSDITSSLILIVIILVISALVYYLFFRSGSKPQSSSQGQKKDQEIFSAPFLSPNTIFEKRKNNKGLTPKKAEKPSKDKDSSKKSDDDRLPSPKKFERPSPDIEDQEKAQALDSIRTDMDNLMAFVNQRSFQSFGQEMVTGFEILEGGNKLTIYVTNTWYYLPLIQKRVMCDLIGRRYGMQTCMYKIRIKCTTEDFPTINFLDHENREVVKMGANNLFQINE